MFPNNPTGDKSSTSRKMGKLFTLPEFNAVFETTMPASALFQQLQQPPQSSSSTSNPLPNKFETDSKINVQQTGPMAEAQTKQSSPIPEAPTAVEVIEASPSTKETFNTSNSIDQQDNKEAMEYEAIDPEIVVFQKQSTTRRQRKKT